MAIYIYHMTARNINIYTSINLRAGFFFCCFFFLVSLQFHHDSDVSCRLKDTREKMETEMNEKIGKKICFKTRSVFVTVPILLTNDCVGRTVVKEYCYESSCDSYCCYGILLTSDHVIRTVEYC